jgi:hypothetical protein
MKKIDDIVSRLKNTDIKFNSELYQDTFASLFEDRSRLIEEMSKELSFALKSIKEEYNQKIDLVESEILTLAFLMEKSK